MPRCISCDARLDDCVMRIEIKSMRCCQDCKHENPPVPLRRGVHESTPPLVDINEHPLRFSRECQEALDRLQAELGASEALNKTNGEFEKLETLKRVYADRDEQKRACRDLKPDEVEKAFAKWHNPNAHPTILEIYCAGAAMERERLGDWLQHKGRDVEGNCDEGYTDDDGFPQPGSKCTCGLDEARKP